ncbi:MAG TPA: serpin family protein [Blastocatellia bacterium]|nr:serpin family protein [Blastocatellia bacterium]
MKDVRFQMATPAQDPSGLPEGQIGQPVYGWSATAHDLGARSNGLLTRAWERPVGLAKATAVRPLKRPRRARAQYSPSLKRAGLFALRESGLKAAELWQRFGSYQLLVALLLFCFLGCSSVSESNVASNTNQSSQAAADDKVGSSENGSTMEDQNKSTGAEIDPRLVSANTSFGFKLYHEVANTSAGKNVFISPASVALCLSMTYNGAVGETKEAMERALQIQGLSHAELNRAYDALRRELENPDPRVQLRIANSLWAREGVSFNPAFIARNKEFYGAEVNTLDFGDPGAPGIINAWVKEKTKDKIEKIVDNIDAQSVLFLINAIYFKGAWSIEFDKARTKDDAFTTGSGSQKRLPMMTQSGMYDYYETANFQALSLPYGSGRVSMYVFLPEAGTNISQFLPSLTASNWDSWMRSFSKTQGSIVLPRFKVEYEVTLNDALRALGMGVAFAADRANFSGMFQTAQNAFISKVKHKTFAEVNEEGTEAAAVTSTEIRVTSAVQPRKTFTMVVNRPFFFVIRDNKTGSVLFLGSIVDPA